MNGRFVELAYQSKLFDGTGSVPFKDVEKFAELIVKECMSISSEAMTNDNWPPHMIAKHFGVEE